MKKLIMVAVFAIFSASSAMSAGLTDITPSVGISFNNAGFAGEGNSRENNESYLLLTIGNSLVKMRTSNGDLVSNFGEDGFVFGVKTLTPPIIHNNLIYVVSFDVVKFYDLFSGELCSQDCC